MAKQFRTRKPPAFNQTTWVVPGADGQIVVIRKVRDGGRDWYRSDAMPGERFGLLKDATWHARTMKPKGI